MYSRESRLLHGGCTGVRQLVLGDQGECFPLAGYNTVRAYMSGFVETSVVGGAPL